MKGWNIIYTFENTGIAYAGGRGKKKENVALKMNLGFSGPRQD